MVKVSIIMGIYNCEDTLGEAIDSIVNQTYTNWELIMCDDCSKDSTYMIAKRYEKLYPDKIKVISNNTNLRLAATLNHCLQYVTGDYIARMDGDDISDFERLEKQVIFLNNNENYDLVGTQMIKFDENGENGIISVPAIPDKYCLRYCTPFCHATIMARKKVYDILKGYTVSNIITRCEDVDLWFRFFDKKFRGYNIQEPLYKVRTRKEDYKRRNFSSSIDAFRVCLKGYKLLKYPYKYYIFLLKPLLSGIIPAAIMKKYQDYKFRMKEK